MAAVRIKSTYSLDVETVRLLESLARQWNVSKSEAVRRSIRAARAIPAANLSRLEAFDRLSKSLNLSKREADAWAKQVRAERHGSSRKRLAWLK